MTAISHAARALTSAFGRLEHASVQLLGAVNGAADGAVAGEALATMLTAKIDAKAAVAVIRFSDDMWAELLAIGAD